MHFGLNALDQYFHGRMEKNMISAIIRKWLRMTVCILCDHIWRYENFRALTETKFYFNNQNNKILCEISVSLNGSFDFEFWVNAFYFFGSVTSEWMAFETVCLKIHSIHNLILLRAIFHECSRAVGVNWNNMRKWKIDIIRPTTFSSDYRIDVHIKQWQFSN